MFEDILEKKNISIRSLSKQSGVGYNYIYKIVKNQTNFNNCGIATARKIANVLDMTLDELYNYSKNYIPDKIYYRDQSNWGIEEFAELNAEINKMLLIVLEYHFSPHYASRTKEVCEYYDNEMRNINYSYLSEQTKSIMVAILNQQEKLIDFANKYQNMKGLLKQKPLKKELFLAEKPFNIFQSYKDMNIQY